MMTKKRTSALASMKLLIVVPVIGLVFLAISAFRENTNPSENQTDIITVPQLSPSDSRSGTMPPPSSEEPEIVIEESDAQPFVVVEEMPMFPGGDAALLKYIGENTQYPET